VVFAMPDRAADKRRLESRVRSILPSPETRSIFDVGAILRRLSLLVTPDTALVHAASCFNVPVAGLYRSDPVHLERFFPYGVPHRLAVSPTSRVADIPVEAVLAAVRELGHG
jgi:heptosyltransferase III